MSYRESLAACTIGAGAAFVMAVYDIADYSILVVALGLDLAAASFLGDKVPRGTWVESAQAVVGAAPLAAVTYLTLVVACDATACCSGADRPGWVVAGRGCTDLNEDAVGTILALASTAACLASVVSRARETGTFVLQAYVSVRVLLVAVLWAGGSRFFAVSYALAASLQLARPLSNFFPPIGSAADAGIAILAVNRGNLLTGDDAFSEPLWIAASVGGALLSLFVEVSPLTSYPPLAILNGALRLAAIAVVISLDPSVVRWDQTRLALSLVGDVAASAYAAHPPYAFVWSVGASVSAFQLSHDAAAGLFGRTPRICSGVNTAGRMVLAGSGLASLGLSLL